MKLLNSKKGFTLIELMTVVVMVAMLVTLAFPRFFTATNRAKSVEALRNLGQLRNAQWRYYLENDSFTNSLDDLDIDNPNNAPKRKFTYSVPTATATSLLLKADYDNPEVNIIVTMDDDGNISKTGL